MPVHDWTRVDAGIFHAFHHDWITELARALNQRVLPADYYALPEQRASGLVPDVLTLQGSRDREDSDVAESYSESGQGALLTAPQIELTAETDLEFYRRKQSAIVVRHVSGDRMVAVIEIVSPGNKGSRHAFLSLIEKAAELLDQRIHLLIIDLFPPGPRDPQGLHAALWDEIAGQEFTLPTGKPLSVAAYETALTVRAYVKNVAVGDPLPDMPLFLEPNACVQTPLEATYRQAYEAMPLRWRRVLEAP